MFSTVGVIWITVEDAQYRGDIMMHVGGYYEYRGGEKSSFIVTPMDPSGTVWSVIHVWDPPLKQLSSQQQIHWPCVGFPMRPI